VKISVDRDTLLEQLQAVGRVASTRSAIQALAGVQLSASADLCELRATDMDVGMRVPLDAEVVREGVVVLPARLMVDVGTHLSEDLCRYFRIPAVREPGIQRDEFESVLERLARAGYRLNDREVAWRFCRHLRGKYAMPLERMATYWARPSALWMTHGRSSRH